MPRSIANAIDQIARKSVGKDWSLYAALLEHWQEIVGKEFADVTSPVKVTFPYQPQQKQRSGGTLTVRLPKGLAMEFTFKSEIIRQRVNNYFGYEALAKIALEPVFETRIKPTAPEKPLDAAARADLENKTKPFEDSALKDALQSFGETLIKKTD